MARVKPRVQQESADALKLHLQLVCGILADVIGERVDHNSMCCVPHATRLIFLFGSCLTPTLPSEGG